MKNAERELLKQKGVQNFNYVQSRGSKWKSRNIPIYIRKNLMIPYYEVIYNGKNYISVMFLPNESIPKVHFKEFAY